MEGSLDPVDYCRQVFMASSLSVTLLICLTSSSELVFSYKNLTSEAEAGELWVSLKSLSTEMSSYR